METIRDSKIHYVEFTATDLKRTKEFYGKVFGWSFVDYGPEYTSFSDGRISGGFRQGDGLTGAGPLVVVFVDDLAAAEQRVKDAGGVITRETFSFPGGSRFHFKDPSGNELSAWHED
jgi:predicted enzyme related to lactoylglutathione lyase